jgi:hypothetical protein
MKLMRWNDVLKTRVDCFLIIFGAYDALNSSSDTFMLILNEFFDYLDTYLECTFDLDSVSLAVDPPLSPSGFGSSFSDGKSKSSVPNDDSSSLISSLVILNL